MACKDIGTQDVRYKARMLCEMLCDDANRAYFNFAVPIVQEFERVNSFFQSENADPDAVAPLLQTFHRSLRSRLYTQEGHKKPMNCVDFGAKFVFEVEKLKPDVAEVVRSRCYEMLSELLDQLEVRIPEKNIFSELDFLSPNRVLSQIRRPLFRQLPLQHLLTSYDEIESQYRKIVFEDWNEVFDGKIPTDSAIFRAKVLEVYSTLHSSFHLSANSSICQWHMLLTIKYKRGIAQLSPKVSWLNYPHLSTAKITMRSKHSQSCLVHRFYSLYSLLSSSSKERKK